MIKTENQNQIILTIAIFLFAAFLRFYNLAGPDLWVDEPFHLYVAESLQQDGSLKLPSGELYNRAKLYAYSTFLSTKILGLTEIGIRFPSALFGFLSLIFFFFFTRKLFGYKVAILSLLLLSILPLEVGWSRVSRFYTLFQFFTILTWYFFYVGFIRDDSQSTAIITKFNLIQIVRSWNICWFYLILAIMSLLIAISIQVIGVFLIIPVFMFLIIYCVYLFFKTDLKQVLYTKYFLIPAFAIVLFLIGFLLIPQVKETIQYSLSYIPLFAKNSSAQDRMRFVKYIMGKQLFPLGAFFAIGIIQAIFRLNKSIIYSSLFFIIQVLLFTFVFSYRLFQYIYNVLPFFIVVSSFAIINVFENESSVFIGTKNLLYKVASKLMKKPSRIIYIFFLVMIFSADFFREGIKIPFIKAGQSNGAVTFLEWQDAAEYVKKQKNGSDIILTTLPLTMKYYLGSVNYNLNLYDFKIATTKSLKDSDNQFYDFYSGVRFIENKSKLDSLVRNHSSGFIIIDTYRLLHHQYISPEVRKYLEHYLSEEFVSSNQTVRVYRWNSKINE